MIRLKQPVIVEGKYDRKRLLELIDGTILETGGFTIFKDPDKLAMLRTLAKETGIIILTDSDAAGFKIRNYIRSAIKEGTIIHVYIPDIQGKERRKVAPSKEGKLGVEGIDIATLADCFARAGVTAEIGEQREPVTKSDFFELGLTGVEGAAALREKLLKQLRFPVHLTTKALLPVINTLYDREDFFSLMEDLRQEGEH